MVDQIVTKMTAAEFAEMPESNTPIELINGEVVLAPSPVDRHQAVSGTLYFVLKSIVTAGQLRYAPADVYIDEINVVQPDLFWVSPESSNCHLIDHYWRGAPDLIIEILSPGTTRRDRGDKYRLYEKHGVCEYWLVDADELYIEVYVLSDGKFVRQGLFSLGEQFTSACLRVTLDVDRLLKT
jgi:Uma2 family endonuclease